MLDSITEHLGKALRDFQAETCSFFDTRELKREAESRQKRQAKSMATAPLASSSLPSPSSSTPLSLSALPPLSTPSSTAPTSKLGTKKRKRSTTADTRSRRKKPFNLQTYKNHSLGDYVKMIRRYGTTDSYSTEAVSAILLCTTSFFLQEVSLN
jgi:hypothetical protein